MGSMGKARIIHRLYGPFTHFIDNPFSRRLLKRWTKKCPRCGTSTIENMLKKFRGEDVGPLCTGCKLSLWFLSSGARPLNKIVKIKPSEAVGILSRFKLSDRPSYTKAIDVILKGIATFGLRRPMATGAPFSVILELTGLCNLNCPHCYVQTYKQLSDQVAKELSTEEWLSVIDELAQANVVTLVFSGGEPLMREDFFELVDYAFKKGMNISLATNGTMVDREVAKRLRTMGVGWVEISIDGAEKDVHDAIRGEGTFEKAVNAVRCCIEEGIDAVALAITLTKQNKDEVDEIFELARDLGVGYLVFLNFIPSREAAASRDLDVSPYEREAILKQIVKKKQTYDCFKKVTILQSTHVARVAEEMAESREKFELREIGLTTISTPGMGWLLDYVGGCAAGRHLAAITARGDILPCAFLPLNLGNVREDNFIDVWTNSPILEELRDRKNWKGRCGRCRHNIVCGGCRARAYAYLGDFLESDPGCILNASLFKKHVRNLSPN